ncbi:Amastin surface glycofamily protein [Leishmania donovani]|uniref:Amastin surface glycofamily protein n=1 Tax=Leishmania donovani TaxID=5661 RepID=A0A504XPS0_LEIDO|nr:Amastin surface glycofamily protein [Leishmania donovani]
MAFKLALVVYVVLQFLAFFSLLVGIPLDMFRIDPSIRFGGRVCVTLWGAKPDCRNVKVGIDVDTRWRYCPTRVKRFHVAQAFAVISVFVYGAAFLFGLFLLWCCSAFRWVCLALNIVGIGTVCVVWVLMVKVYNTEGEKCLALRRDYVFGAGFGLFLFAWVLDIIDIFFLLLPLEAKQDSESTKSDDYREQE